ncbi:MAG TPA: helix-hairpin-helix domain-containing protein [Terracidiphilus sp.]|nr:helix-hairpin-helix domain-containing protein [Terracidiphilus sp.]
MRRAWDKGIEDRALHALALMAMCAGLVAISMFTRTGVSARKTAGQAAGPSATTDGSPLHPEFPPGDGREAVMRVCVKCHSPNIILAYGQNRTGWENTITKMARLGAKGSDDDYSDIADYLTANFPPSTIQRIFVNMATDKQIAAILDISLDDAGAIVAYRDKVKGFKSLEDMKKVPNVDTKKIDANKDHLVF